MIEKFTKIEQEVLKAYCDDCKEVKHIAQERHRSESTIATILYRMRVKLKASNNRHMVKLYWQWRSAGDREVDSWGAYG